MKRHLIMGLSLALLTTTIIPLTSCGPSNNSSTIGDSEQISEQVSVKRLKIKALPNKVNYSVGEKFTSEGLKVSLITTINGEISDEVETNEYTLSISEGSVLTEGEFEVMVKSKLENVRSTHFDIIVKQDKKFASLIDVINNLVTNNNYTVKNTIGGSNHVVGLMTKDALIWNSDEEAYFMDEGIGYGRYNNDTFRYKIEDNKIVNASLIKDLGGNADDQGLFSSDTYDDLAERRISNYNIQGITKEDLTYLENDCKPSKDNPNRYQISLDHCKWLFNAIGHTQLTINPTYFLSQGKTPGQIYIEVKDFGLEVNLITEDTFDGVRGCVATIENIGTTEIPGMNEFLKNPTFTKKETSLDILQNKLNANDYKLISHDASKTTIFNPDYIYSPSLQDVKGNNLTMLNVKEGNKLNKEPGLYNIEISENNVTVLDSNVLEPTYLCKFDIFKNLNKYFVQDENMLNNYKYVVSNELEETSGLIDFLSIFTEYNDAISVKEITINLIMAGANIFQTNIEFIDDDNSIAGISLIDFGKAKHDVIDNFITNTLY